MSNSEPSKIPVMLALVKREFQEQRALFVYLPVAITLMLALLFILVLAKSHQDGVFWVGFHNLFNNEGRSKITVPGMLEFAALPVYARAGYIQNVLVDMVPFVWLSAWGVPLYYFSMSLYTQRKNRSILFWNSMPLSNTQTVVAKLLAGMIGFPLVMLACTLALQGFMLVCISVRGAFYHVDLWQTFFVPWPLIFSFYASNAWIAVIKLLWIFPVYGWLLLASARLQSLPFFWAVGPWGLVSGIEYIFTKKTPVTNSLVSHLTGGAFDVVSVPVHWEKFPTMELALGIVAGIVLVCAAIRFNRSEEV